MSEFPFDEFKETDFNEFERFFKTNTVNPIYDHRANFQTNSPSFYEYLAKHNHLIKILAKRIYDYDKELAKRFLEWDKEFSERFLEWDKELDKRFLEWDKNLEEFDDEVLNLLQEWIDDGTFDHIINDTIFSRKADKSYVDDELEQTKTQLKVPNQVDFVAELQKLSSAKKKMSLSFSGSELSKRTNINIQLNSETGVTYEFYKNQNDDYLIALNGTIGYLTQLPSETLNPISITGGTVQEYPPNYHATEIGATLLVTFIGTKVEFYSYVDNRGGLWEFILDEGTPNERVVQKSVYNSTADYRQSLLFEELENRTHTLKAVFKGQDPSNPVTTPRGWFFYGTEQDEKKSFIIYSDSSGIDINKKHEALYKYSNKEFAIQARPAGSNEAYHWIPEHNAIGTAFKVKDEELYVDGEKIEYQVGKKYASLETFQLVQHVQGFHPSDLVNPLMEIITYHTIKDGVLNVTGKIKFLRDTEIDRGFALMFPYNASFAKKIKTSNMNEYDVVTDQPTFNEYWIESDRAKSFVVLNNVNADERQHIATAMTIDNFEKTMRVGEGGRATPFSWIEHRNSNLGKLYFCQFQNTTLPAGYEYHFNGRYIVTIVNGVSDFLL